MADVRDADQSKPSTEVRLRRLVVSASGRFSVAEPSVAGLYEFETEVVR